MKNSLKYIILIIIFVACVAGITMSYLHIHYKKMGNVKIITKYYDIVFNNVIIGDSDSSVKIDNDEDYLHIEIPKFKNNTEIVLDAKNLGNMDAVIDSFSYTNIVTNMNKDFVKVTTSLSKDETIKGGEEKKLIIRIVNNGEAVENPYYNFNINYVFKEVSI